VAVKVPQELRRFVQLRSDVEGILQRSGRDTYDLIVVDLDGAWTRWVFTSQEYAEAVAADLGVLLHHGWDDERLTRRFSKNDPWNTPLGVRRAL
jgi:hypothetical protein